MTKTTNNTEKLLEEFCSIYKTLRKSGETQSKILGQIDLAEDELAFERNDDWTRIVTVVVD